MLEKPFEVLADRSERPDRRGRSPLSELLRLVRGQPARLETTLTDRDILLCPDIFQGPRIDSLRSTLAAVRCASIAIFHDAAAVELNELSSSRRIAFINYLRALAMFDLVICISRESEISLLGWWDTCLVSSTKTCVEPWPIEFDDSLMPSHIFSNPVVLCVGSFERRKNHRSLLLAAERSWQRGLKFELRLIGRTTRSFGRSVVRMIKEFRHRGRPVTWLLHVDDRTLQREYSECRFTVYPSLMEGFGLPIFESLWYQKPCICGNNGALGEAAKGGGCLTVNQTDIDELSDALASLLNDQSLYERLSLEASRRSFRSWADYIACLQRHIVETHELARRKP